MSGGSSSADVQDDESSKRLKKEHDDLQKFKKKETKKLEKVVEPLLQMFGTVAPVLRPSITTFLTEFEKATTAVIAGTSCDEVDEAMQKVAMTIEQGTTMIRNFKK